MNVIQKYFRYCTSPVVSMFNDRNISDLHVVTGRVGSKSKPKHTTDNSTQKKQRCSPIFPHRSRTKTKQNNNNNNNNKTPLVFAD